MFLRLVAVSGICVLGHLIPVRTEAEIVAPPKAGDTVRIDYDTSVTEKVLLIIPLHHTETKHLVGEFVSRNADSITIDTGFEELSQFSTGAVKHFYVATGSKRNTLKGALIGAGLGGGVVLVAMTAVSQAHNDKVSSNYKETFSTGWSAGVVVGAALTGGVIGWLWKTNSWREITLGDWQIGATVDPGNKTTGLCLTLDF